MSHQSPGLALEGEGCVCAVEISRPGKIIDRLEKLVRRVVELVSITEEINLPSTVGRSIDRPKVIGSRWSDMVGWDEQFLRGIIIIRAGANDAGRSRCCINYCLCRVER